jgi:acyl-CoA dehydrogenase
MPNYFLRPADVAPVPHRHDPADDEFLFRQGPARGLGAIRFHDWRIAYDSHADLPNVARFREQADGLCALLRAHPPDETQQRDLDFLLPLGQLFALAVYGQLILEQAELSGLDRYVLDEIFAILIQDFSAFATELHGKAATTDDQAAWALANIRRPVSDATRTATVWDQVVALCGMYEMQP